MTRNEFAAYQPDDGYSGELTRHVDQYSIVVYADMTPSGTLYGFDVYDESDEEAISYGETFYRLFGIWSLDAAIRIADEWIADNC